MFETTFEKNGRTYISATFNKCPVCADRDPARYMLVRYAVAGGDLVCECPECDYTTTMSPGQVILNAYKQE